ncbi:MAG: tRNA glutamyl-Q(34) synthetase GluQRS [Pseudomonadota bacterium]
MTGFRTRFAPSPTGYLHLGHALAAWHVWAEARSHGGPVLLRIEDIDTTRCRPVFHTAILEDLAWLGFDWPEPVRVQSAHFDDYASAVMALAERGLAYRCFKTRAELASQPKPYTGGPLPPVEEAERLGKGEPFAWRLSLRRAADALPSGFETLTYQVTTTGGGAETVQADPTRHGDIVIARKDSPSAYHLAATHDDALQRISHVIRGQDLIDAPHIQVLLQALMDWPTPIYRHHGLVLGDDGQKLSKRNGALPIAQLRRDGMTAQQIWKHLGVA